ncbi:lysozyme [Streptomyces ochraceiscleroticus]|uniref:Lysozyme n=1 Tax=Streptomyces ochraceiscleroticus TaxID=47761 RepID=A0ABW1MN17_9ACTN|nr:lysozyme [Streptomyces ochraceiscleroticus]
MARDHKGDHTPALLPRLTTAATGTALALAVLAGAALTDLAAASPSTASGVPHGHDVSSHQKNVDWPEARANGARFVYVKATESTSYTNPYFGRQYRGARQAGLLRGAYHFAVPNQSSGTAQARYFLNHGGQWKADGRTLPPALDIEHNPYSKKHKCYGVSKKKMVRWIWGFSDEIKRQTGRRPVIYTTTRWWNTCTGGSGAFAQSHPLWLASWHGKPGKLPKGWSFLSIWQYSNKGRFPGDQNAWNGTYGQLRRFAAG